MSPSSLACSLGLMLSALALSACAARAAGAGTPPTAASAAAVPQPAPHFSSPYTYEWFLRAELLRASGQLADAVQAYRTALAGADEDAYLLARLASALAEQGQHQQARQLLDEALRLEPASEAAWLARAELAQRRGEFEAALGALERAEQAEPLSPRAPLALAALLRAHGSPERASAVLLRYEARSLPGTAGAQAAHLTRALASRDADRIFAATLPYRLFTADNAAALQEATRVLLEQGRAAQALRVIDLVPEATNESTLRLRVLLACGRWASAEAWLGSHEALDHEARVEFARAQLSLRHPDRAAQIIEAEQLEGVHSPDLQLLAAQIELARGAYAGAALRFARIPAGSSSYAAARLGLDQALRAQGQSGLAAEVSAVRDQ